VRVCSPRYPTYNSHAPYCHLFIVRYYDTYPHNLTICTILKKKKLLNIKHVFRFPYNPVSTFVILPITRRNTVTGHSSTAVQCSTVQYNTIHYSTVQHNIAQYSTAQYSKVQYSTVQYSTVQHNTAQYSTAQHSRVKYSTVK